MIKRELYLKKLRGFRDKQLIKVVTGIRRCGKSTLLELFKEELVHDGVKSSQIISVNFEDLDNSYLLDPLVLHKFILDQVQGEMTYVFLDEVQLVPTFEKVLDSLYIRKNIDLYVTGSNANMLSGELATMLSGRYIEIAMLPLGLKEFAIGIQHSGDLIGLYQQYLATSSFPYVIELNENKDLIRDYLEGVFNTVILKDVVARKKISDVMMLDSVIRFMFDSVGSIISIKKISDTMTSMGRKISSHTVESYIQGLQESYILYQVKRYDLKGKQHLKTQEKYYIADIGLRNLLVARSRSDRGHILENVVFLELKRQGYEISIGKIGSFEVDFVAVNATETLYIQVAASIASEETFQREIRALKAIKDHFPKYILTLDPEPRSHEDGIHVMNALDFIMGER